MKPLKSLSRISLTCAITALCCGLVTAGAVVKPVGTKGQIGHESPYGKQLWSVYKQQFLHASGRIIDNVNKGVSHSEGQGYGMLLALHANDLRSFERIWLFAQKNLQTDDGLFAWRFNPHALVRVPDKNNATDGDLLIAWALLEAAERGWGDRYRQEGERIANSVLRLARRVEGQGVFLLPGKLGFEHENGRIDLNPSYWVIPAFERLAALTGNTQWQRLLISSIGMLQQIVARGFEAAPDWISILPDEGIDSIRATKKALFGYEAIRVPLYLFSSENHVYHWLANKLLAPTVSSSSGKIQITKAESGRQLQPFSDPGYGALISLSDCLIKAKSFPVREREGLDKNYYPATLQLLALFSAEERYPNCF